MSRESQNDERCSVFRDGEIQRINPIEIVVGDLVILQAGDAIPAGSHLFAPGTYSLCTNSIRYKLSTFVHHTFTSQMRLPWTHM